MRQKDRYDTKPGGIILAGGRSSRMGAPKAALRLSPDLLDYGDGGPAEGGTGNPRPLRFLDAVAIAMQGCVREIVLSVGDGWTSPSPAVNVPFQIVADETAGAGPVAGLAAALQALRHRVDVALVCPCDAPLVPPAVFQLLAESIGPHRAVICEGAGRRTPLLGAYRTEDAVVARELIEAGERRAMAFAEAVNAFVLPEQRLRSVDPQLRALCNINTPEDLAALQRKTGTRID